MACFSYAVVLVILVGNQKRELSEDVISSPDPIIGYALLGVGVLATLLGALLPPMLGPRLALPPYQRIRTLVILRCAMFETLPIMGLLGGILGIYTLSIGLGFIGVGAVSIICSLPGILSAHEKLARSGA